MADTNETGAGNTTSSAAEATTGTPETKNDATSQAAQAPTTDSPAGDATPNKHGGKDSTSMHVKVYSPFNVYFDAEAESISAENETGPFDILPRHHNFMTLLRACEITVRTSRGEQKIKIAKGIMHVKADEVIVFLDV
jgi:ATP synthase, Delta/Epsilon chain, beta-sandwich domain